VGAALDFITGSEKRAPLIARKLGLEWAHRLLSNPRRMWRRYLVEGPAIFLLAYRWRGSAA
jgi:exopolysaccharide biosynthesis WecB/TagA/CpsF family protein